jgi:small subunit ribosomal protein S16
MHGPSPRDGKALAQIGTYDPLQASVSINEEQALRWLNQGAQMTPTVKTILQSQGILERWQGKEGAVDETAFTGAKPARQRKLAKSNNTSEETNSEDS